MLRPIFCVPYLFDNFNNNFLACFKNIFRFFNAGIGNFGYVYKAFYPVGYFNDSAERQETGYNAFNDSAFRKCVCFGYPGIFLSSFNAEGNAFVFAVNFLNENGNFGFRFEIACFYVAVPGKFGIVNKTNKAFAYFYKQSEISNAQNFARYNLAFFNAVVCFFFSSFACCCTFCSSGSFSFAPCLCFCFAFSAQ